METVRPMTLATATVASTFRAPGSRPAPAGGDRPVLEPAVSIELKSDVADPAPAVAERRRIERDAETQTLVYRVSDPVSGEVIVQIPDATVLKARAYARQVEAVAGERVERRA